MTVAQSALTTSSALWSRRCLDAVLWHLMHRCVRKQSESVPAVVCAFCATSLVEVRVLNYLSLSVFYSI